MLQVFAQLCQRHDRHILARRNAEALRHHNQDQVTNQVVQQMVAVVAPLGHLLLRMVQGMQLPPPVPPVLAAMQPVIQAVKQKQVEQQTHQGLIAHAGPKGIEVQRAKTSDPGQAKELAEQGLKGKKYRHAKQAQPVHQGVDDIGAQAGPVFQWLHWTPALQRANH